MFKRLRRKPKHAFSVKATWDEEAQVWVATSDDIPGLVTEAPTQPELLQNIRELIPDLLELNGEVPSDKQVPLELLYEQTETLKLA